MRPPKDKTRPAGFCPQCGIRQLVTTQGKLFIHGNPPRSLTRCKGSLTRDWSPAPVPTLT